MRTTNLKLTLHIERNRLHIEKKQKIDIAHRKKNRRGRLSVLSSLFDPLGLDFVPSVILLP